MWAAGTGIDYGKMPHAVARRKASPESKWLNSQPPMRMGLAREPLMQIKTPVPHQLKFFCKISRRPICRDQQEADMTAPTTRVRSSAPTQLAALASMLLAAIFAAGICSTPAHARAPLGGPFALTDENGHAVTARDMRGHPYLIFFGFTHCADVDRTTLTEVSAVLRKLGPDADRVGALFVTVDPQRDTPKAMKDYLSAFDPHIRGLTGAVAAVDAAMKAYHIYHHKVAFKGGYAVDHTTTVYLVDKNGNFVGPFDVKRPPEDAAAALRRYF